MRRYPVPTAMTSTASAPTNTAMSWGASRHTRPPRTRQNTTTQNTAHRVPLRIRARFWAPKFWATKVEKALPKSCTGM